MNGHINPTDYKKRKVIDLPLHSSTKVSMLNKISEVNPPSTKMGPHSKQEKKLKTPIIHTRFDKYGLQESKTEAQAKIDAMYKAHNIIGKFLSTKHGVNNESWLVSMIRKIRDCSEIPLKPTALTFKRSNEAASRNTE